MSIDAEATLQPRKTPRQRRAVATVEQILRAGAQVLAEDGYARASTNRIAEVAGVSVGSLYQYFPNKDALILALAEEHMLAMTELLRQTAQAATGTVDDVVRTFVRAMIEVHRPHPELHRALVQQTLHLGFERFAEQQVHIRGLVELWIRQQGDTLRVADPKMAAFLLVASVESVVHVAVFEDPALLADPSLEEELVTMVLRYLTGGAGG